MKDYLISEVAGGFSLTLDAGASTRKAGAKAGRISMQVGAQPAPPPSGCGPPLKPLTLQLIAAHKDAPSSTVFMSVYHAHCTA